MSIAVCVNQHEKPNTALDDFNMSIVDTLVGHSSVC